MVDYELIDKYIETARAAIESEKLESFEDIDRCLRQYNMIFKLNEETFDELIRRVLENVKVSLGDGVILEKNEKSNWFIETRVERGSKRFDAYEKYLEFVSGYPRKVITGIGNSMDKVMNNIGDPLSENDFFCKGLVIGDVQSGKTGNFIALMNKAADAGYNVIVVTTGTIEKLRRQTQERIEAGFGGFDSGSVDVKKTVKKWARDLEAIIVTTKDADFKKNVNFTTGVSKSVPMVAVIKKNKTSLESLASWLEKHNGSSIDRSLLYIDDEADNATINTRDSEDPTTINKGIRNILKLFRRASYVGFTATPFANVLIDHTEEDDLFPSDFIQVLDTPSNYLGAQKIFGDDENSNNILVNNDDAEEFFPISIPKKERKNFNVDGLPESLLLAIKIFFLQNAIRDIRGDKNKHRSMLVNVSHLVNIQRQANELISIEVGELKRQIKQYILDEDKAIHKDLRQIFEETFNIKETWDDVYKTLYASTDAIICEVINAQSKGFKYEDYRNGARVIAVGGFALSRGLTLEGLSVSYLYRNTMMYDTLMQMGRWFGYRPNYDDIIKIFMPNRSVDWYCQILDATEDLKGQIRSMINEHLTPKDFGIYIRGGDNQDETTLLITARNKMKSAMNQDVSVRISGDYKETTKLPIEHISHNRDLIEEWIYENKNIFDDEIMAKNCDKSMISNVLENYIYGNFNKLNTWVVNEVLDSFDKFDIKIIGNRGSKIDNIIYRHRQFRLEPNLKVIAFLNSRVGSPNDGKYGLSEELLEKTNDFKSQKMYFSQFSKTERNPLILLYPLQLKPSKDELSIEFHKEHEGEVFWAISLGVPNTGKEPLVYRTKINTVLQQQLIEGQRLDDFVNIEEDEEDIDYA